MKDVLVRTLSSLLAAVIAWAALSVAADGLSVPLKLLIAGVLGAVAFFVAVWASGGGEKSPNSSVDIASDMKANSIRIQDATLDANAAQNVRVATNLDATGPIEITGVKVNSTREK